MVDADETLYRETIQQFLALYRYLRRYGRQMQQEGISGRKISTLRYLIEAGPLTIGQLSAYLCISDSSGETVMSTSADGAPLIPRTARARASEAAPKVGTSTTPLAR